MDRNRAIVMDVQRGVPLATVAETFGLSVSQIKRITHTCPGTLNESDFKTLRRIVSTYGVATVAREMVRVFANYGNTSERWARISRSLHTALNRESL